MSTLMRLRDGRVTAGERRVLLLAPAFPPSAVAGTLRWEGFAEALSGEGYAIDAVTMAPDEELSSDVARMAAVAESVRIYAVRTRQTPLIRLCRAAIDARNAARAMLKTSAPAGVRTLVAVGPQTASTPGITRTSALPTIPLSIAALRGMMLARLYREYEVGWGEEVVEAAEALCAATTYHAVISSGPPNEVHVYGRRIAKRFGIPFVMDMRDPWGTSVAMATWRASGLEQRHAEVQERLCVSDACAVLANTGVAAEMLRARHPHATDRIHVIRNGTQGPVHDPMPNLTTFRVVYAGSVYLDRNPGTLFRAARRVIDERGLTPSDFVLEFIGDTGDTHPTSVQGIARALGLSDYLQTSRLIPRRELLPRLRQAAVLVSLNQEIETSIPAKVFEYLMFPAWLMVMARPGTATHLLMEEMGSSAVDPDDEALIARMLGDWYEKFRSGVRPAALGASGLCSRRDQAAALVRILDGLTGPHGTPTRDERGGQAQGAHHAAPSA